MTKAMNHEYVPDEVDHQLIRMLTNDGRASYRELAQYVSLSETRVRVRTQRLIREGYIRIVAIPNLIKLNAAQIAMLGIQVSGNIEKVADILAEYEQITFLTICAGKYEIIVEVAYSNTNSLLEIIQRIRNIPDVKNTDSFVYLKTPKSLYSADPGIMRF
ncbi:Lrp/AsnC family transcriptional regulator for asnA, asnC and gidA [Paenibacillus forsythiae]|uniref:Lrp/AsnC family transcriptional regulator for asnA, asnC and gidA n=1 Tax=Paenibacillus forsythiae TaxID=365616 RepID=A0ABU3H3A7_9BACL|nr:Lrp/AsnC family transcriptional regulator [Paenibacillus forsythiae]MDT3425308.1 Lrp/AsnC family transcriptional regulator for asnA, asnC and gidA [Paenibacillus forsythiae]